MQRPRGLVKELHEPVWWEPECFGEQEDKGVAQLSDLNEILFQVLSKRKSSKQLREEKRVK